MQAADFQIFTVINEGYLRLGIAWAEGVRRVSRADPTFVCADRASLDVLQARGFECRDRQPEQVYSATGKTVFPGSSFPSDAAAYVASLKMASALDMLVEGRPVLFSDVDAIWLGDPLADIARLEADIVFQPASFPAAAKQAWGFAICTGFVAIRPSEPAIRLIRQARDRFDGSDQRTLNSLLLQEYDLSWAARPEGWESCELSGGWTEPLHGACRKTGLTLAALPHAFYQRHGTTPEACGHAVICHPNSPKDEAEKLKVLQGLDLLAGV